MPGENACELTNRLTQLKSELEDLEQKEFMLDQQRLWVEQSIRNITEDCSKYPFYACLNFNTLISNICQLLYSIYLIYKNLALTCFKSNILTEN